MVRVKRWVYSEVQTRNNAREDCYHIAVKANLFQLAIATSVNILAYYNQGPVKRSIFETRRRRTVVLCWEGQLSGAVPE